MVIYDIDNDDFQKITIILKKKKNIQTTETMHISALINYDNIEIVLPKKNQTRNDK